jgi:hypothetical protein
MDAYDKCTNLGKKNLADSVATYGRGGELFRPPTYSAAEVMPPLLHPKEHEISNTEYPLIPSLYKRPKSKKAAVYQTITGNAKQRRAWNFVF